MRCTIEATVMAQDVVCEAACRVDAYWAILMVEKGDYKYFASVAGIFED